MASPRIAWMSAYKHEVQLFEELRKYCRRFVVPSPQLCVYLESVRLGFSTVLTKCNDMESEKSQSQLKMIELEMCSQAC